MPADQQIRVVSLTGGDEAIEGMTGSDFDIHLSGAEIAIVHEFPQTLTPFSDDIKDIFRECFLEFMNEELIHDVNGGDLCPQGRGKTHGLAQGRTTGRCEINGGDDVGINFHAGSMLAHGIPCGTPCFAEF